MITAYLAACGGWLLPSAGGLLGDIFWQFNNVIIYSPIVLLLVVRGQSARTVYLSADGLPIKLAAGVVLAVLAVFVFLVLRGDPGRLPGVLVESIRTENLRNFLPVFLEGVAIGAFS